VALAKAVVMLAGVLILVALDQDADPELET
jgi:hypothetical protein